MAYNDLQITPQDYKSGVIPFDNLTQPADSGLEVNKRNKTHRKLLTVTIGHTV